MLCIFGMKIVLYTNLMTPYRKHFYDLLYRVCKENGDEFCVLVMSDNEKNRTWHYKDLETSYSRLLKGKTISIGETYIHINYGLKRIIRMINPDIVIAAGSYLCPGTWTIARARRKYGYKALFWSESHLGEVRQYASIKLLIREKVRSKFYGIFDGFLCPGRLATDFVKAYAGKDKKIVFLPNLVDEKFWSKREEDREEFCEKIHREGKVIFFTPARLSRVKGIGDFLELLSLTKKKNTVTMLVAGEGEQKEELEERAKNLQIDLRLIGNKSAEEIAKLYRACDFFVLPSLSDPNPLSCIEALWSRKPLLISEHVGNYPEVIKQGCNGYMFSYRDKNRAVEILNELLDKTDAWKVRAGEESYTIAQEIYDSKKTVERVRKELEQWG